MARKHSTLKIVFQIRVEMLEILIKAWRFRREKTILIRYSIQYFITSDIKKQTKNDKNRNEELKSVLLNDLLASLDKNQLN